MNRSILATSLLLLLLATPVQAGVSAEMPVSTTEIGDAPAAKWKPSVATNGDGYFAVWRDDRGSGTQTLIGTRVSRSGEVLDPLGIHIADRVNDVEVVWSGDAWLVVWTWPGTGSDPRPNIMVARIERDGRLAGMTSVARGHANTGSSVATNGSHTAILYLSGPGEVRSVVIDSRTNILGDHQLAAPGAGRDHLSVTPLEDGFFAVWNLSSSQFGTLEGARLDATGRPLEPARLLASGFDPDPEAGGDGNLVVLLRYHSSAGTFWSTRQVRGDLTHVTSPNILPMGESLSGATLVRTGDGYVVLAEHFTTTENELTAIRLDASGAAGEPPHTIVDQQEAGIPASPAAVTNGSDLYMVWVESTRDGRMAVVRGQLFDATTLAQKSAAAVLSRSAVDQTAPAIASSGRNQLVVWNDTHHIRAGRLSPDGRLLDGPGFVLSNTPAFPLRVVFDGRSYVVAWGDPDTGTITVRFVDPGTTLGNEVRVQAGWNSNVTLATSGATTVVAWTHGGFGIMAMSLGRDTQQVHVEPTLLSGGHIADFPAIAWNGSDFLLAWVEHELVTVPVNPFIERVPVNIRGTRLSASLLPLDPGAPVLGDTPGYDITPELAALDGEWLLAWVSGMFEGTVRARRIGRDLTPAGDPAGVDLGPGFNPKVIADGTRFVVGSAQPDGRIRLTYLTRELAATTTTVDAGITARSDINLAPAANGRTVVVYSRLSLAPEHGGVHRAFVRFATPAMKMRAVR